MNQFHNLTSEGIFHLESTKLMKRNLIDVLAIHRFGKLAVGEPIMMVATAGIHRSEAFLAADFLMDYLKSRAPFWKKELGPDGEIWVASKDEDEAALKRW